MPAAPAVVNDVFDAVGSNASVAYAPGSINLLGEDCASSGGMLLTTAIPALSLIHIDAADDCCRV